MKRGFIILSLLGIIFNNLKPEPYKPYPIRCLPVVFGNPCKIRNFFEFGTTLLISYCKRGTFKTYFLSGQKNINTLLPSNFIS